MKSVGGKVRPYLLTWPDGTLSAASIDDLKRFVKGAENWWNILRLAAGLSETEIALSSPGGGPLRATLRIVEWIGDDEMFRIEEPPDNAPVRLARNSLPLLAGDDGCGIQLTSDEFEIIRAALRLYQQCRGNPLLNTGDDHDALDDDGIDDLCERLNTF